MAKTKTYYVCEACGDSFHKWAGKCESCGQWNTLKEFRESKQAAKSSRGAPLTATSLGNIDTTGASMRRYATKLEPLDEVLGGGIVPGSVVLTAGQPGIGKSTLLMQLAARLSDSQKVLYVSGEESERQVALRAKRLGENASGVELVTSNSVEDIVSTIKQSSIELVIVDSIQTVATDSHDSSPGSTAQITQSAHILINAAKSTNTAMVLVGHVTKEGSIAGPKILEHLVDVVLHLEGDRYGGFKVLRGVKNRYGSTNEIGLFEMKEQGLIPVENPSAAMLAERQVSDGSVVLATMEGTRPLLVEVQALVNRTSYGYPKRTASGFDYNRLNVLIAVLNRRTKLDLSQDDVYVNIVGGVRISEHAADLAVCMAIASASKGMQLKDDAVVFGEVGLSGEVRHVPSVAQRVEEANKLGFKNVIGPNIDDTELKNYTPISSVRDALNSFLTKK